MFVFLVDVSVLACKGTVNVMSDYIPWPQYAEDLWATVVANLGEKSNICQALNFLRHKHANDGFVRCNLVGLGFAGDEKEQRKAFLRYLSSKTKKIWYVEKVLTKKAINLMYINKVHPILNPLTSEEYRKLYGDKTICAKGVPLQQLYMKVSDYAYAIVSANNLSAERFAKSLMLCQQLLKCMLHIDKPGFWFEEKINRVSESIFEINTECIDVEMKFKNLYFTFRSFLPNLLLPVEESPRPKTTFRLQDLPIPSFYQRAIPTNYSLARIGSSQSVEREHMR